MNKPDDAAYDFLKEIEYAMKLKSSERTRYGQKTGKIPWILQLYNQTNLDLIAYIGFSCMLFPQW